MWSDRHTLASNLCPRCYTGLKTCLAIDHLRTPPDPRDRGRAHCGLRGQADDLASGVTAGRLRRPGRCHDIPEPICTPCATWLKALPPGAALSVAMRWQAELSRRDCLRSFARLLRGATRLTVPPTPRSGGERVEPVTLPPATVAALHAAIAAIPPLGDDSQPSDSDPPAPRQPV